MARHECERCHTIHNTTDGIHVCKDVARRLKRRHAQELAVLGILFKGGSLIEMADAIVAKLANMGVADD